MKAKTSKKTGGAEAARRNGCLDAADRRRKAALEAEYASFAARDRMREDELARRKERAALIVLPAEVYKWLDGVADKANATPGEVASAIVGAFHELVMDERAKGKAHGKTDLPTTRGSLEIQAETEHPEDETRRRPSTDTAKHEE